MLANDAHGLEAIGTLRALDDLKILLSIVLLVGVGIS